jgi:hypothetical protein
MNARLAALVLDDRCLGKSIGSRLLFICGVVHVKSVRYMSKGHQSGAPCFLYAVLHM